MDQMQIGTFDNYKIITSKLLSLYKYLNISARATAYLLLLKGARSQCGCIGLQKNKHKAELIKHLAGREIESISRLVVPLA